MGNNLNLKRLIMAIAVGGLALGLFLMLGPPRLLAKSSEPGFCAGCHVMKGEFEAWMHSGAHSRITCVDCHLPNGNPASHYVWKAIDGTKDLLRFYSGRVDERIKISAHGMEVVQENCLRCHQGSVAEIDRERRCWECHRRAQHRLTGTMASR